MAPVQQMAADEDDGTAWDGLGGADVLPRPLETGGTVFDVTRKPANSEHIMLVNRGKALFEEWIEDTMKAGKDLPLPSELAQVQERIAAKIGSPWFTENGSSRSEGPAVGSDERVQP